MKWLILAIFVPIQVMAGNILSPEIDCDGLKDTIVNNKIKYIDDIFSVMPSAYLKNAALIYESHAAKRNLVSFETPRIILFNEDGSMILSISRNPGADNIKLGRDSLEAICFNKKEAQYKFLDIVFDGEKVPFVDFAPEVNPTRCLNCHGANPRPILQDYNAWPGFYGSFAQGGVAAHGSIEKVKFLEFIKNAPNMKRYNKLDLSLVQPDPYDTAEKDLSKRDLVYQDTVRYNFTPVVQLGQVIQRNMEYRLAAKIIKSQNNLVQKSIRSLLAYIGSDLNTCGNIRDRIKEVYAEVVKNGNLTGQAEALKANLKNQIDFEIQKHKVENLLKYNMASEKADPRGIGNIPKNNSSDFVDPYYPDKDSEAYMAQLVLMQAIGEYLGLTSEDISSFPEAPTLGLGHIMRLGLYKDEQYFLGYTEAMIDLDQFFLERIENDCDGVKKRALEQAQLLSFGENPTVFAPGM